jgi:hypothetical protein
MKFDVAVGMDNPTLNQIISEVYKAVYPNLFKDTIAVGQMGIASVNFDINSSPSANLQPMNDARAYFEDSLKTNKHGPTSALSAELSSTMIELAAGASFGVSAPIALTINYTKGTPSTTTHGTLSATLVLQAVTINGTNYLTVHILSASVSLNPPDPILEALLNKLFIPVLIPYLNQNILTPIQIPMLKYGSLQLSLPVPAVQFPFVTAYSALGAAQPDVPPPSSWPLNCVYLATDSEALQAAAAIPFPLGPKDSFNWEIISGQAGAQVLAPTNFVVNSDGSISAQITAYAGAQLTLHTPNYLPNVSFGPKATALVSATFKPSLNDNTLAVSLEGFPIPYFNFDWGIPSFINWLFDPLEAGLAAALNEFIGPLIAKAIHFPPISVYTIPTITFTLAGKEININFAEADTTSQNSMLLVKAQVRIS